MRQRLTFAGAAAALVLVCGTVWFATLPRPAFAMGEVADSIRQANSYEYTLRTEINLQREPGKAEKLEILGRFSWQVPGSYRIETKGSDPRMSQDTLLILPAGEPGLGIDRKAKTYQRQPARHGQVSPLMMVEKLGGFSGKADRLLGTKTIAGRSAKGFEIEARKVDPDIHSGPITVWVDARSNLPVLVRYEIQASGGPVTVEMADFHWNARLDPRIFDPTPPEGYAEKVPPPSPLDDQIRKITQGLKIYAKYSGGHYPRVKMLYGDVTRDELVKLSGAPYPVKQPKDLNDPRVKEVNDATWGFATINVLLRENPDALYHGKTVGPSDKDKVLLRWKLDDATYAVLYGDLRSETVTPERLKALEGN